MTSENELNLFDDENCKKNQKTFKLKVKADDRHLIKSKDRVQHHGEVFTPNWMVKNMLAEPAIQAKLRDLHATFLEPSAGEGAFLTEILHQKLTYVDEISNKTTWQDNALWALMSIYAIELLSDNVCTARKRMMEVFSNHYQAFMQKKMSTRTDLYKSAKYIIEVNIVQGNTLTFKNSLGKLIKFRKWVPTGNKVKQYIFTFKSLFNNDDIDDTIAAKGQLSLFDDFEDYDSNSNKAVRLTKVYEKKNEQKI